MQTVIFIGSNPANASVTEQAFHGSTKSSKILSEWIKDIDAFKVHINVMNKPPSESL